MSDFFKDLHESNKTILELFENEDILKNFEKKLILGKCSSHDLELVAKVEIKEDKKVKETNNVAIEFEHNKKPAGISTTGAHFWMFILHTKDGEEIRFVETVKIKDWVRDKKWHRTASGPDGSELYLFSLEWIRQNTKLLKKD